MLVLLAYARSVVRVYQLGQRMTMASVRRRGLRKSQPNGYPPTQQQW